MPSPQPKTSMPAKRPPRPVAEATMDALKLKRQELDKEIAEFRAQKEEEYNRYKTELEQQNEARSSKDSLARNGIATNETSIAPVESPESKSQQDSPSQSPDEGKLSGHATPTDERELESRSHFVPSYLPLLEDPPRRSRNKHNSSSRSTPKRKSKSAPSPLSSSLTTLSNTAYVPGGSPLQTPTLSSSQPRPSLSDRRSSSKSDTTIDGSGLRSSLRRPKTPEQETREASGGKKHVLFSIDNVVMSPSSSPVVQRTVRKPAILLPGLQILPESDLHATGAPASAQTRLPRAGAQSQSFTSQTPASPSMARSYHELVEPMITTPTTPASEEHDFAMNAGEDPLFDFDEDIQIHDASEDDERSSKNQDSDEELPKGAQSPHHVGSLPIEIRWPGRKGV